MKYMGSKRAMLRNGLGQILLQEAQSRPRFVDLFAGSGAVAAFIAARVDVPVHACDLQQYSGVLAGAVLQRTAPADHVRIWKNWRARAARHLNRVLEAAPPVPLQVSFGRREVQIARRWCADSQGAITRAYGGHYFSPRQALWLDSLRATIALDAEDRLVSLAALLDAASECAASPGHTAQPFQPTSTARRFLADSWCRNVPEKVSDALEKISSVHARRKGSFEIGNANQIASKVGKGDLVFVDPPYSALQYSRFYHVLESLVSGEPGRVEGVGRYPDPALRPKSAYSVKSKAANAMRDLLSTLASRGADVVLTFPDHACSNGLSGATIKDVAKDYFLVSEVVVKSRLSTLGGVGDDCIVTEKRGARRNTSELILILRSDPRRESVPSAA